ncbi:DUF1573 domain-containing protein [Tuwongella immobilis]|uniref:DUF1573 domain-containing protein n=1 Tax=Tuwongella immobilis TaxID=692036 RepID=A0A6C2YVA9_9BACT|nr:DUF1573 domain-containing protein [Tuwongella immobilis]VIP05384.1 unnamed protein product [Tuwongella immobilis]VTS08124.1 unnamed protein product [Tuwongella immobilis]
MTWIIRILTAASLGTLLAAGWFLAQPAPTRTLEILNPHIELGEVPSDQPQLVVFRIRNSGSAPKRVVNFPSTCNFTCCYRSVLDGPQIIPPHSELEYVVEVKPRGANPFQVDTLLVLEDIGTRPEHVHIEGIGIDPNKPFDIPLKP